MKFSTNIIFYCVKSRSPSMFKDEHSNIKGNLPLITNGRVPKNGMGRQPENWKRIYVSRKRILDGQGTLRCNEREASRRMCAQFVLHYFQRDFFVVSVKLKKLQILDVFPNSSAGYSWCHFIGPGLCNLIFNWKLYSKVQMKTKLTEEAREIPIAYVNEFFYFKRIRDDTIAECVMNSLWLLLNEYSTGCCILATSFF